MKEKILIYNGYKELYLKGIELEELLKEEYYATGRHHSVIKGITIPEFLKTNGIQKQESYRIFINDSFCQIMDESGIKKICFFAHNKLENVKLCKNPLEVRLDLICPVCGASMIFKKGRYGEFLGCSNYPKCKFTENIPIIGNI